MLAHELNPFNPASLRLDQSFVATAGVKKLLTTVPVRKPNRQDFVRVHPDAAFRLTGLRTLGLPAEVREVIVLADGDDPGEAAARDAALRWKREGRRVRIARPPLGLDFDDLLLGRAPSPEETAA